MMSSDKILKMFQGVKSRIIVSRLKPTTYCLGKDKETGKREIRRCHRENWEVKEGTDFITKTNIFPRITRVWNLNPEGERILSLKNVKQLLFYSKMHPDVLEVYQTEVQRPDETSLPDAGEIGDIAATELPKDNENKDTSTVS
jgi:hypothetical protein